MKEIDFATLTLQDALDFAVLLEEEACERYEDLAAQMDTHDTPAAAEFFRFMVKNEAKHGHELAARRTQMFGTAPTKVDLLRRAVEDGILPGLDNDGDEPA